jgi:hypothetical protein
MNSKVKEILEHVASWPEEDQQELAEVARDIEARRAGIYVATLDELQALDEADRSGIANDKEIRAAFGLFRQK